MASQDIYKFPPKSLISFYNGRDKLITSTKERRYDLAVHLMLWYPHYSRTVYMGVAVKKLSDKWNVWDEDAIKHIEYLVKRDFQYDGYYVRIIRLCPVGVMGCDEEFRWKLMIRC
jgi:hypothetical protein